MKSRTWIATLSIIALAHTAPASETAPPPGARPVTIDLLAAAAVWLPPYVAPELRARLCTRSGLDVAAGRRVADTRAGDIDETRVPIIFEPDRSRYRAELQ